MTSLALRLFGYPRVSLDGMPVELRRRKAIALLAYLAVTEHAHSRDALAALFWPGYDQTSASGNLRRTLSILNRDLGSGWLAIDRDLISLSAQDGLHVDVVEFWMLLRECESHGHGRDQTCPSCIAPLRNATELYSGDFLAGFSLVDAPEFGVWQVQQAEYLRRLLAEALKRLAQALAAAAGYDEAIPYARRWLDLDSLHEPAHRMLMRLYVQSGDRAAAVHQYEECVAILGSELELQPESETVALYKQILAGNLGADAGLREAPAQVDPRPQHNLPDQFTPFVGRRRELEEIGRRLADPHCRLLTIVGPGGMGKTRLAIQAARQHLELFRDGVCFVDLAAVSSPDLLASSILHAVAPDEYGDANALQRLREKLHHMEMLLVLDNFEHLLDSAVLLPDLLHTAPGLSMLVTSRERLNLQEEWLEPLEGLAYPGQDATLPSLQDCDSTRFFQDCVRRVRPNWRPSEEDAAVVAGICQALEGMPLGIELAAAWTRTLPPAEVSGELERGLSILSTSLRNVPDRHRSMNAVFDQSWAMLQPHERSVLRQLAVFRGGCSGAAAKIVAGASLSDLTTLVDGSWLRLRPNGQYSMHALVHRYCEEKLENEHASATGEAPAGVRRRHCDYYVSRAGEPDPRQELGDIDAGTLELEYHNVGSSLDWAVRHMHLSAVGALARRLRQICFMLGWLDVTYQQLSNAAEVLDDRLGRLDDEPELKEKALEKLAGIRSWQIPVASNLGRFEAAGEHIDQLDVLAHEMPPSPWKPFYQYYAVFERSVQMWHLGDYEASREYGYDALSLAQDKDFVYPPLKQTTSQRLFQAHALAQTATASLYLGLYDEAEEQWRESIAIADEIEEKCDRAEHCAQLSRLLVITGAYAQAEALAQEGLSGSQACGSQVWIGMAQLAIGEVREALGDTKASRHYLTLGTELWKRTRFIRLIDSISLLGRVELARGDTQAATARFHHAIHEMEVYGAGRSAHMIVAWLGLGWASLAEGNTAKAGEWFRRALASGMCAAWEKTECVAGLAEVAAREGQIEQAVELLALVVEHPFTAHAQRQKSNQALEALRGTIAADVFADRVDAGVHRDLDATLVELLN